MSFRISNYNQNLSYRIVEVIIKDRISYKITQPKRHWLFGLSKKFYDVQETIICPYDRLKTTLFFKNKEQVELFININTFEIKYRETIVEEYNK